MRQRIQLSNAIRGHMAEFGVVAPIGREGLRALTVLSETERALTGCGEARHACRCWPPSSDW